ncbi:MAG: hypothetical protein CTY15_00590 [Methylocystis sp.]|nr:MAG: hypothetical protein CTY15_00590 [Methylocystis sp.]
METGNQDAGLTAAGVVLGVGIGGFFDGIVFHQLLQWHHLLSGWRLPSNVENLEANTLWDGLFHVLAFAFVAAGLWLLWRAARRRHVAWSGAGFAGALLMGWGGFNLVEGLVNHHLLGLHHVNETVPPDQWAFWDWGFILWGAVFLVLGRALTLSARRTAPVESRA